MEEQKAKNGTIKLLLNIKEFKLPTEKAMWEDPEIGFKYLATINAIAVITGKEWLKETAETIGAVIPNLKIEGFEPR